MTDTWANTRTSVNRLKAAWAQADEDTRWDIGFWSAGLGIMATAIIVQFGWLGLLFCGGAIIWSAGHHALTHS